MADRKTKFPSMALAVAVLLATLCSWAHPASADDQVGKPYRGKRSVVEWVAKGQSSAAPGSQTYLWFTAKPDANYHVYKARVDDKNSATNFAVAQKSKLKVGAPVTKSKVISKPLFPGSPQMQHYHHGTVTWTLPIDVPAGTPPGNYTVQGFIGFQACSDNACLQPEAVKFSAKITVGQSGSDFSAVALQAAKRGEAMDAAAQKWTDDVKANDKAVPSAK